MEIHEKILGLLLAVVSSLLVMFFKSSRADSKEFAHKITDLQARTKYLEENLMTVSQIKTVFQAEDREIKHALEENTKALEKMHDLDKNVAVLEQRIKFMSDMIKSHMG